MSTTGLFRGLLSTASAQVLSTTSQVASAASTAATKASDTVKLATDSAAKKIGQENIEAATAAGRRLTTFAQSGVKAAGSALTPAASLIKSTQAYKDLEAEAGQLSASISAAGQDMKIELASLVALLRSDYEGAVSLIKEDYSAFTEEQIQFILSFAESYNNKLQQLNLKKIFVGFSLVPFSDISFNNQGQPESFTVSKDTVVTLANGNTTMLFAGEKVSILPSGDYASEFVTKKDVTYSVYSAQGTEFTPNPGTRVKRLNGNVTLINTASKTQIILPDGTETFAAAKQWIKLDANGDVKKYMPAAKAEGKKFGYTEV